MMEKKPIWDVTPEKIANVVGKVVEEFDPRRIIQFGSTVQGTTHRDSDLDLLIVMKGEVPSRRQASVEIRRSLLEIIMPMDILVISEADLDAVSDNHGMVYHEALKTGRILYDAA